MISAAFIKRTIGDFIGHCKATVRVCFVICCRIVNCCCAIAGLRSGASFYLPSSLTLAPAVVQKTNPLHAREKKDFHNRCRWRQGEREYETEHMTCVWTTSPILAGAVRRSLGHRGSTSPSLVCSRSASASVESGGGFNKTNAVRRSLGTERGRRPATGCERSRHQNTIFL
jgi:hypothetical protein